MTPAREEVRLAPESIEALAVRLAELLGPPAERDDFDDSRRMLTAAQVSRLWGVSRRWVYEHARDLGAQRLGDGPRPRLRFDPEEVAERLRKVRSDEDRSLEGPRRRHKRRPGKPDNFGRVRRQAAGGRCNAPGPAPKEVLRPAPKPSRGGCGR